MASPVSSTDSNPDRTCFYCNSVSTQFRRGWRLRGGGFAMLCNRCGSAYQDGSFCGIFHLSASGWRNCLICKRPIHCGCIMSANTHTITDLGGIKCKGCLAFEDVLLKQRILSSSVAPQATSVKLSGSPSPADSSESEKTTGQKGAGSSRTKDTVACSSEEVQGPEVVLSLASPALTGSPIQAQAALQESEPEQRLKPSNGARFSGPRGRERTKLVPDASGFVPLHPRYSLNARGDIPRDIESNIVVFEKILSAEDADPLVGRLALPKKCAETFFRKLSPGEEVLVKVQDEGGADWELSLCLHLKGNRLMYTLERLGDFMSSKQGKAGDIVTIKIEQSGKLIIGLVKGEA